VVRQGLTPAVGKEQLGGNQILHDRKAWGEIREKKPLTEVRNTSVKSVKCGFQGWGSVEAAK